MALPASGPLSSSMISNEIGLGVYDFSVYEAGVLSYSGLNALSISSSGNNIKIDYDLPMSMSMWYSYNHALTLSGSEISSSRLLAPSPNTVKTMSIQETFAQYDMGVINATASFTASGIVSPIGEWLTEISYSVYYSSYSTNMQQYTEKLLKSGVFNSMNSSGSFNYTYNASSGSIITFRFQNPHSYSTYGGGG